MTTRPSTEKLRVGVLIDGWRGHRWVRQILDDIAASSFARVVLVVMNTPPAPPPLLTRLRRRRDQLLYLAYTWADDKLFARRDESDAVGSADLAPPLAGVPVLEVVPQRSEHSDRLEERDLALIREHHLDVALRFGFRILRGGALDIARAGVWSYHHGDNQVNRGGPAGVWEVLDGTPTTGSILQILTEDLDAGRVLVRSWAPTNPRSARLNRRNYYAKSGQFVLRKLRELHERGEVGLASPTEERDFRPYSHRLYRAPNNLEMLRGLAKIGWRWGRDELRRLRGWEQWILAYHLGPASLSGPAMHRFSYLQPPGDRFWADPFPVRNPSGQGWYVFLEEYLLADKRGRIAVMAIGEDGSWTRPVTVLTAPHHLSYPCVFSWNGAWYMVPESAQNRSVDLYRAVDFPWTWKHAARLMSGVQAVDTTIAEIDGRWWMFTCSAVEGALVSDELFVYHADTPLGPWLPHRQNPVKSDARSARPAGRPFKWNGAWYRPAQDCSERYGRATVMNRIDRLDPDGYVETEVSHIEARWDPRVVATHTYNEADGLAVIDALLYRRRA